MLSSATPRVRGSSSYFAAEQGFPGKQIGIGSPDSTFPLAGQLKSGLQGGIGLDGRAATPNAVPNTANKNPSMIFVFTVPLQRRSGGYVHGF